MTDNSNGTFNALVVRETEEGNPKSASASIEQLTDADLPDYDAGDVVACLRMLRRMVADVWSFPSLLKRGELEEWCRDAPLPPFACCIASGTVLL